MARKSFPASTRAEPILLTESVSTARSKLEQRIAIGEELLGRRISTGADIQKLQADQQAWSDYDRELLRKLFTTDEPMREYNLSGAPLTAYFGAPTPGEEVRRCKETVSDRIEKLKSIIARLELYENQNIPASPAVIPEADPDLTRAFMVHGRDSAAKEGVARFLAKLGVEPIILQEQASSGRTLIEKLEHYGKVSFAVVLLTPDDEGRLAGSGDDLKRRARQNVLLELGYFVGLLGRDKVCALCKPPVEVPSDWDGVVWVPMDEHDGWKVKLAKELRAAGFTVDLSALM